MPYGWGLGGIFYIVAIEFVTALALARAHRGADGIAREQQLLVDYLCASTGGPMVYTGREMKPLHVGMRLDEEDWKRAMAHLTATLDAFEVPEQEKGEVMSFHENLKLDIVEV